jgi:hypothetical protein
MLSRSTLASTSSSISRDVVVGRPWRILAVVVSLAGIWLVSACSTSKGATKPNASVAADPGTVAVSYTVDLYSGDLTKARNLVYPPDTQTFDLLSAIIRQNTVSDRSFAAGSATVRGDTGVVVLLGTFCTAPPAGASAASRHPVTPTCVTNKDRKSNEKQVQVSLIRATGQWYVNYPK